jgi:multidrug efflux pump subunit AcrB
MPSWWWRRTSPIIATTLVLVAVFLPVAAMGGITGRLYQQFALTVTVSVLFSSLNALTLSPALCSLLLRKPKPYRGPLGKFFGVFNSAFDRSTTAYMGFTKVIARKIARGLVFILVLVVGIGLVGRLVPGGFMPEEDMGYLFVNIQLPDAASLQRSDVVAKKVESIIARYDEVEYVTSAAGFSLLSGSMASNAGFIFVSLRDWDERTRSHGGAGVRVRPPAHTRPGKRVGIHSDAAGPAGKHTRLPGGTGRRIHPGCHAEARDQPDLHHLPGQCSPEVSGDQPGQGPQGRCVS